MSELESLLRLSVADIEQRKYLGSADMAAILSLYHPEIEGLTKYVTAGDTWLRVVHSVKQPSNPKMSRGLKVEPELRQLYRDTVGPCTEPPGPIPHPRAAWGCASPDGLVGDAGILEAKSTIIWARHLWGRPASDAVPLEVALQCQWLCECTGREWVHVLAAFGEDLEAGYVIRETAVFEVARDAELCAELFRCAERFWREHCATGVPPGVEPRHNKVAFRRLQNEAIREIRDAGVRGMEQHEKQVPLKDVS